MYIKKSDDGKTMTVELVGEVDSMNAPEIEETLSREVKDVTELIFDLSKLEYISAAGLRMLLQMQKMMKTQGNMTIKSVSDEIMDIFKVTGFVRLLNIV